MRAATPETPAERNRKLRYTVNRTVCAMRNRIERFFNRLKESCASRPDTTIQPNASSVSPNSPQ
jgi:hypothetical protein